MSTLIHGSNLPAFRALKEVLDTYDELSVSRLTGSELSLKDLKEALLTPALIGKRLVVVEDLSRNRSQAVAAEIKKYLYQFPQETELIFYERRSLPPESPLLNLTKKIKYFPEPKGQSVFEWADSVGARQLGPSLSGWQERMATGEEPEYLLLMLVRQFRLLLLLAAGEDPKVPPFVKSKLSSQVKFWRGEELKRAYQELWRIDRENKTGVVPLEISLPAFLTAVSRKS